MGPSDATEGPHFQAGAKANLLQEPKSREVRSSTNFEEKVPLQLSSIRDCGIDDHLLEYQSFGVPSHPQSSPKKGFVVYFNFLPLCMITITDLQITNYMPICVDCKKRSILVGILCIDVLIF